MFVRRCVGGATCILGAAGTALALFVIIQAGPVADQWSRQLPAVASQAGELASAIQNQGEAAVDSLDIARSRLQALLVAIDELAKASGDPRTEPQLDRFATDFAPRLEQTQQFVTSMQRSLRSASGALSLLQSIPFFGRGLGSDSQDDSQQLAEFATSLEEAATALDQITVSLDEIRRRERVERSQVQRLEIAFNRLDQRLKHIQANVHDFSQEMKRTADRLETLQSRSRVWIERFKWAVRLFFACFAVTQVTAVCHGFCLLKRAANVPGQTVSRGPSGPGQNTEREP